MAFADRVKALQLPPERYIVIGSGLLDQLGLRVADDIDLAVDGETFESLRVSGKFTEKVDGERRNLRHDRLDIWDGWGDDAFEVLLQTSQYIDGIRFVSLQKLIEKKRERGLPKDIEDIRMLEEYSARV